MINDPETSAKDLENIIERDPPLSARLLRLSNSAYYSYPKRINNIREAIILIGFNAVKELALSQKVCELFELEDSFDGYSRILLWKHSVAVAVLSKLIYRREFRETGENAYVTGLLHDIGIIIIDQFLHTEFKYILRGITSKRKNMTEIEDTDLGFNHTEIGKQLALNWKFPDMLAVAIGSHHNPLPAEENFKKLSNVLYISDYICQQNKIGYCDSPYKNDVIYKKCLRELDIKENGITILMEEVKNEITKMENSGWF